MATKPSSPRRIQASRANGARSRGPITPEGKARSAQNALKHGLTARSLVLSGEDADIYNELRATYYTEFQPRTRYECDLVDNVLNALWHSRRTICVESATYDVRIENQRAKVDRKYDNCSPDVRAAIAFSSDLRRGGSILHLGRLLLFFDRQYQRAFRLLMETLSRPPNSGAEDPIDYRQAQSVQPFGIATENRENEPNPISGHHVIRFRRRPVISICGQ